MPDAQPWGRMESQDRMHCFLAWVLACALKCTRYVFLSL